MLVKLEPTNNKDAALDIRIAPNANAVSSPFRARAAWSATGVMKTTDVSRFNTAVTTATASMVTVKRARSFPGVRATRRPTDSNRPSRAATCPMNKRPVMSTKGCHECDSDATKRFTVLP